MAIPRARASLQVGAGYASEGIPIPLTRGMDDLGREGRWRRLSVPRALLLQVGQVVAQRLLVETGLATARLVRVSGPEARGIGRQDLVDDHQLALRRRPKFELGIGDDNAALRRIIPAERLRGASLALYEAGRDYAAQRG